MSIESYYYSLTVSQNGANTAAYFSVSPTSNLEFSQGGAQFMPTTASMTSVSVYPTTLQIQSPAGMMSAGVTIITSASEVAGRVLVSPPIDVATVVTLYGASGQIGQYIVDPGSGGGVFNFPVTPEEGVPVNEAAGFLHKILAR